MIKSIVSVAILLLQQLLRRLKSPLRVRESSFGLRHLMGQRGPGIYANAPDLGEVFPGSSLPNAMVQLTPVTKFHSGSGYQYEDTVIYGFAHTSKGHWNLCNIPLLPATGAISPDDYSSPFSHQKENAHPGYYQVYLERYAVMLS